MTIGEDEMRIASAGGVVCGGSGGECRSAGRVCKPALDWGVVERGNAVRYRRVFRHWKGRERKTMGHAKKS